MTHTTNTDDIPLTTQNILLALAMALLSTLAFFPGALSPDSLSSYRDALRGVYHDQHPPALALLIAIAQIISPDISFFTFIQSFLLYWSLFFLVDNLSFQSPLRHKVLIIFLPVFMQMSVTLWKDVWAVTFACLSLSFLIRYARFSKTRDIICLCACFGYFTALRQNSILILLAFPMLLIFFADVRKRWLATFSIKSSLLLVGMALLVPFTVRVLTQPVETHFLDRILMHHGIVYSATYYKYNQELPPLPPMIEASPYFKQQLSIWIPKSAALTCAESWSVYWKSLSDDPMIHEQLKSTNIGPALYTKMLFEQPASVLRTHLCVLPRLLNFSVSDMYFFQQGVSPNNLGLSAKSKTPALRQQIIRINGAGVDSRLYAHFLALTVVILSFFVSLKREQHFISVTALFGFCYFLSALPFAMTDWRYLFFTFTTGVLLTPYLLEKESRLAYRGHINNRSPEGL